MDPLEEQTNAHFYAVGDVGRPQDIAPFRSGYDNLLAVARLRPNDPCFVRRSGGKETFTFAKLLTREYRGGGPGGGEGVHMELLVKNSGATKTIPLDQCAKYIRILNSSNTTAIPPSPSPVMEHQGHYHSTIQQTRKSSETTQSSSAARRRQSRSGLHASFHSGLDPPSQQRQHHLQRQTSLYNVSSISGIVQGSRPSLSRQASLHASGFHSRPSSCARRGSSPNASLHSGIISQNSQKSSRHEHHDPLQPSQASFHSSRPALRRGSSLLSSISTRHWNRSNHGDASCELSSVEYDDSKEEAAVATDSDTDYIDGKSPRTPRGPVPVEEVHPYTSSAESDDSKEGSAITTGSDSSSNDESPCSSSPKMMSSDLIKMKKLRESVRKVRLPRFDYNDHDDIIQFNARSLLLALNIISEDTV